MPQYKAYSKVQIEGARDYVAGVEELSDNKMRTQWPSHLHLRQDY